MRMKMTSAGPHRDDLCVRANGIDIRRYGSQGQQRTAALSLKLSEIYIVERKIKDTPILLLDEATSALDVATERRVLKNIMADTYPRTCIVTTHRPTVLNICTRVYAIRDKKCEVLGEEEIAKMVKDF